MADRPPTMPEYAQARCSELLERARAAEARADELIAYVDAAKRELGDQHIIGQPLAEAVAMLRAAVSAAESRAQKAEAIVRFLQARGVGELRDEVTRLRKALEIVIANDRTTYRHHEPRPSDGARPETADGTIWATPKQIASAALREVPRG